MVEMLAVESSNILEVGFDEDTETLYITFKSGITYSYENVPYFTFEEMQGAESVGSYFHKNIRGVYAFTKLQTML